MKIIVIIILTVFGCIMLVRILESKSIFYPSKEMTQNPRHIGIAYKDVYMTPKHEHIRIHGWLMFKSTMKKTILFLHGNAGNISDRLGKLALFDQLGVNVLIIDYRGYGQSEGRPTEEGMYHDAQAAYDYLIKEVGIKPQEIIVYGASLGGVAAVHLAAHNKVGGVIIDSSFTSAKDMARYIFPFIPSFMVSPGLDSLKRIMKVDAPKLFFHSIDDQTVPFALGKKLYEAADQPKDFVELQGGHNDGHIQSGEIFHKAIHDFIYQLEPK